MKAVLKSLCFLLIGSHYFPSRRAPYCTFILSLIYSLCIVRACHVSGSATSAYYNRPHCLYHRTYCLYPRKYRLEGYNNKLIRGWSNESKEMATQFRVCVLMSVCLSLSLSLCVLYMHLYVQTKCVSLSILLYMSASVCICVYLPVSVCVGLSVCLSISLFLSSSVFV